MGINLFQYMSSKFYCCDKVAPANFFKLYGCDKITPANFFKQIT